MTSNTIRPFRAAEAAAHVSGLIGQPYASGGLHCWKLTRRTVWTLFGLRVPLVTEAAPAGLYEKARLFAEHPARREWGEVAAPGDWAVVLMGHAGRPDLIDHAGTYLALDGGAVLHTDDPHGVVFESLLTLRNARHRTLTFLVPR